MQEDLISFETAKLAKEKGFELDKYLSIDDENPKNLNSNYNPRNYQPWYFDLTQSLLQKWLREVHNIFVFVDKTRTGGTFQFSIHERLKNENSVYEFRWNILKNSKEYESYDTTLEVGIKEALKLINN